MEPSETDWRDLQPDQRLTYLIGDIVRSDNFLEWEARGVYQTVAKASPNPPEREHRDLAPLLDAIKDTLRGVAVATFAREMARQAVIEAAAAHKQRKGPVHDYWMHQGGSDERWVSVSAIARAPSIPATPHTLDAFLICRDGMLRAAWRMRGVGLILPMWFGDTTTMDYLDDDTIRWWTAAALGRFRTPSGPGLLDVDKDDTLPLPPGRPKAKTAI